MTNLCFHRSDVMKLVTHATRSPACRLTEGQRSDIFGSTKPVKPCLEALVAAAGLWLQEDENGRIFLESNGSDVPSNGRETIPNPGRIYPYMSLMRSGESMGNDDHQFFAAEEKEVYFIPVETIAPVMRHSTNDLVIGLHGIEITVRGKIQHGYV